MKRTALGIGLAAIALIGGCASSVQIRVESPDGEPVGGVPVYLSGVPLSGLNGIRGKIPEAQVSEGVTDDHGTATVELDRRGFAWMAVHLDDPNAEPVGVLTGIHAGSVNPVKVPTSWTRLGVTSDNENAAAAAQDGRVVSIRRAGAER